MVCHVGKAEHRQTLIDAVIEQDKKLDILGKVQSDVNFTADSFFLILTVSNAAVNPTFGPMLDTEEWAWDKIFEVNVKNAFQLIQETTPYLEETKGNITCISSIAGFQPMNLIGVYSVSKTALIGLCKVKLCDKAFLPSTFH